MSARKTIQIELRSEPAELRTLRTQVQAWLTEHDWPERAIGELVLALDEAVTNVICHGYDNCPGQRILITGETTSEAQEGDGVVFRVRDFGKQVDPKQICGRDLDDVRPGGLGVHIIKAMSNVATYERAEGGGMLLTMQKLKSHVASPTPHRTEPE